MKNYMILLAGGIGSRTGLSVPKQYHTVDGEYVINFLLNNIMSELDKIILVCDPQYVDKIKNNSKLVFVNNGNTRLESLQNGFQKLKSFAKKDDLVFIHEAARVMLNKQDIDLHKKHAKKKQGLITSNIVFDTMFKINDKKEIVEVIKKQNIVAGYNPQSFYWEDLEKYSQDILNATNDLDLSDILIEKGFKIKILEQIANLRKVTIKEDVEWIEETLRCQKK